MFRSGCRWIAAAGFPIRKSPDLHLYTATRGLSQCPTSFIGVWRQGIHRLPLITCSRDAEKSNFFSYVDALSIQLLRCECGGSFSLRWVALTSTLSVSTTRRWPTYTTQPGSLPGCFSLLQCAAPPGYLFTLFFFSQSHQPFAVLSSGGDEGIRTPGLRRARAALSQLSYIPIYLTG